LGGRPPGLWLVQLAWIVPVCLSYRAKGETETVKGIAIIAAITFLLNAGCWGVVFSGHVKLGI
jgi:hypothetical protein